MPNLITTPKNISKEKLQAFQAYYEITKLNDKKLSNVNTQTILNTLATIFDLGLSNSPIKKEIALIPYGNDLQVQIQEDGFLTLIQRSNLVLDFQREVITDKHIYNKETEKWEIDPAKIFETKNIIGYYGSITMNTITGKPMRFIKGMTKQQCLEWKQKYSKAQNNSPWVTAFDQMALKTVIKSIIRDILKSPNITLQNQEIIKRAMQVDQATVIEAETIRYDDNPNNDKEKIKLQPTSEVKETLKKINEQQFEIKVIEEEQELTLTEEDFKDLEF